MKKKRGTTNTRIVNYNQRKQQTAISKPSEVQYITVYDESRRGPGGMQAMHSVPDFRHTDFWGVIIG